MLGFPNKVCVYVKGFIIYIIESDEDIYLYS